MWRAGRTTGGVKRNKMLQLVRFSDILISSHLSARKSAESSGRMNDDSLDDDDDDDEERWPLVFVCPNSPVHSNYNHRANGYIDGQRHCWSAMRIKSQGRGISAGVQMVSWS